MVLFNLGTRQLIAGADWVEYDEVTLDAGFLYLPRFNCNSASPDLVYSTFGIRARLEAGAATLTYGSYFTRFEYDQVQQMANFLLYDFGIPQLDVYFQAKRYPFWSQPSQLADVTIECVIDDAIRSQI